MTDCPDVIVASAGSGLFSVSWVRVGDGVRRERHQGATGKRAELRRAEDEEQRDQHQYKSDHDPAGVDQAAVIDGLIQIGLGRRLRGAGTHRGPHGGVNLVVALRIDVTRHAVLGVLDGAFDLHGGRRAG